MESIKAIMDERVNEWVLIKESRIHSTGLFAAKDILKGTELLEYVGRKVTKEEAERIADEAFEAAKVDPEKGKVYLFELDDTYDIDGNVSWNPARFINHSCDPNCEVVDDDGRLMITAIRDIKEGEELTYNYGYDADCCEDHPCHCGSKDCVGFIVAEDQRDTLKDLQKKTS